MPYSRFSLTDPTQSPLLLIALSACGSKTITAHAVTFGFLFPYTNSWAAPIATASEAGVRIAQNTINKAGGLLGAQVQVRTYDVQGDGNTFMAQLERAVETGQVSAVIGDLNALSDPNDIARVVNLLHQHEIVMADLGGGDQFTNSQSRLFVSYASGGYLHLAQQRSRQGFGGRHNEIGHRRSNWDNGTAITDAFQIELAAQSFDPAMWLALAVAKAGTTEETKLAAAMPTIFDPSGTPVDTTDIAAAFTALKSGPILYRTALRGQLSLDVHHDAEVRLAVYVSDDDGVMVPETIYPPGQPQ